MDTLTAIRTFAAPGFTPAKRVKIFADRWYLVAMQNVEHGQGDYIGLGEGEYIELLPGAKARERRDAHLNHCNRVAEYNGAVFELLCNRYGGEVQHAGYFVGVAELEAKLDERKREHDKWVMDCRREGDRHTLAAQRIVAGLEQSIMTPAHHLECAKECMEVAAKHAESFRCEAKRIR